jgi:hypothetical protein
MDENQENPEEQASEGSQSAEKEQPKLREITEEELKQILERHEKYYESDGKDGKKADLSKVNISVAELSSAHLSGANFSGANLSAAKLSKADLREANLSEANLSSAELSKADLSGANLSAAELTLANLREANLSSANLREANLTWADLSEANLSAVNLSKADLSWANLRDANLSSAKLSGAAVDEFTLFKTKRIKGGQIGVNGIWAEYSDSAALMTLTPPGNSMQGPNLDAVIESLKRSRRLHGYSLALVGIVLLIATLNLSEIEFPWTKGIKITPDRFGLLAMPISIGLLIIVNSFLSDALNGARYIQTRQSAMSVGNFPWALSRYAGAGYLNKILSFFIRFILSFHPLVYIYFLEKWKTFSLISQTKSISITIFIIFSLLTVFVVLWTFLLSQRFQKPILFDRRTEEDRKDNIEELIAVKEQTNIIKVMFDIFERKEEQISKINDSD